MSDIFISYSRRDSALVDEFVRLMEGEGFRVWIDRDGIESGDAFKKIIVRAIKESGLVVFFSSEYSNASSWTAKEISVAVHHGKTIIPIKIDNTVYNDEVEFDLVSLDYIDYTDVATREAMKAKLLRTLRAKLPERWDEICAAKTETDRQTRESAEGERIAREETERKAKEAAEMERLERGRKIEDDRRRTDQESRRRERAEVQHGVELKQANQLKVSDTSQPKPKKRIGILAMIVVVVVTIAVVLMVSSRKQDSNAFYRAKVQIESAEKAVFSAKTCDELYKLAYDMQKMIKTCGVEKLSASEQQELEKMSDEFNAMVSKRRDQLQCGDWK